MANVAGKDSASYLGVHVKCPILTKFGFLGRFSWSPPQYEISWKYGPVGAAMMHSDRRVDMTRVTGTSRDFENAPKYLRKVAKPGCRTANSGVTLLLRKMGRVLWNVTSWYCVMFWAPTHSRAKGFLVSVRLSTHTSSFTSGRIYLKFGIVDWYICVYIYIYIYMKICRKTPTRDEWDGRGM